MRMMRLASFALLFSAATALPPAKASEVARLRSEVAALRSEIATLSARPLPAQQTPTDLASLPRGGGNGKTVLKGFAHNFIGFFKKPVVGICYACIIMYFAAVEILESESHGAHHGVALLGLAHFIEQARELLELVE